MGLHAFCISLILEIQLFPLTAANKAEPEICLALIQFTCSGENFSFHSSAFKHCLVVLPKCTVRMNLEKGGLWRAVGFYLKKSNSELLIRTELRCVINREQSDHPASLKITKAKCIILINCLFNYSVTTAVSKQNVMSSLIFLWLILLKMFSLWTQDWAGKTKSF